MQPTGNKDPNTGKDEYLGPDGVSKVYLAPEEFAQLKSMSGATDLYNNTNVKPKVMEPIAPQASINTGITPEQTAALKAKLSAPAPAIAPAAPIASGVIEDDSGAKPAPLAPITQDMPVTPVAPQMGFTSESTTTRKNVSPALAKKEDEAAKAMATAVTKESEANAAIADAQAQSAMAVAAREKQFVEAEQVKQAKEQEMIAERQAKLDAISEEYANMKIDSNNFWAKKSTGDSILAALALGLGAFADVASGSGESQTLKILQAKMDQDIEIQKANMAQAGRSLDNQRGLFTDILRQTGDERIARLKTHELGLNAAKAEFAAIAAKSGSDLVKSKAMKDIAALDQALVQNKIEQAGTIQTQVKTAPVTAAPNKTLQSMNEDFAKEMTKYRSEGRPKSLQRLRKTDDVVGLIKKGAGKGLIFDVSGRIEGEIPKILKSNAQKQIEQAANELSIEGMADALGPQFTQKEGEMFKETTYDPTLPPEKNLENLLRRKAAVEKAMLERDAEFNSFIDRGYTLQGADKFGGGGSKVKSFKPN